MAIDTHIKFDGVEGESSHEDHKGEIEVLSWSWGVNNVNAGAFSSGTGSGKGKATPNDFTFMHQYDKASPLLARRCADGKHFSKVTLTARKSGEGQKDFLVVKMKEVFITSVQPGGSSNGEVHESVSMSVKDAAAIGRGAFTSRLNIWNRCRFVAAPGSKSPKPAS